MKTTKKRRWMIASVIVVCFIALIAYAATHRSVTQIASTVLPLELQDTSRTIPMTIPSSTISTDGALLRWNDTDERIATFEVYVNDQKVATLKRDDVVDRLMENYGANEGIKLNLLSPIVVTSYELKHLKSNTTYTVRMKGLDQEGNAVGREGTASFTTLAIGPVVDIRDYGARGDGRTNNTEAIQNAIHNVPAGGVLKIPAGTYVTGALFLHSYMTVEFEEGAILKASSVADDFLLPNRVATAGTPYLGILNIWGDVGQPIKAVRIVGPGVLNGNSWQKGFVSPEQASRLVSDDSLGTNEILGALWRGANVNTAYETLSPLVTIANGTGLYLAGLTLVNSPGSMMHIASSEDVIVYDMNQTGYGTNDGYTIDGSNMWFSKITMNHVNRGFVLKARADGSHGIDNIVIDHGYFENLSSGITIANEGSIWAQNITIQNSVIRQAKQAVELFPVQSFSGGIRNVYMTNSFTDEVEKPMRSSLLKLDHVVQNSNR